MQGLVRRIGPLGHAEKRRGRPNEAYGSLVRTIVGQQLSTKAARSIYGRLTDLFDGRPPTPQELLSTDEELLRGCGLSRPKVRYLRDLADRVVCGELDLGSLQDLPDDEVIVQITAVKGLGRWSADMFLMFHLGREDVLPVGDLGVRRAAERAYDLPEIPDAEILQNLARPWAPHRTLASFYLWTSSEGPVSQRGNTLGWYDGATRANLLRHRPPHRPGYTYQLGLCPSRSLCGDSAVAGGAQGGRG